MQQSPQQKMKAGSVPDTADPEGNQDIDGSAKAPPAAATQRNIHIIPKKAA